MRKKLQMEKSRGQGGATSLLPVLSLTELLGSSNNCRNSYWKKANGGKKMTRQEVYDKIFKMLEKEQFHLQNRYEFGEIDLEMFEELSSKRYEEYLEYVRDLAICNDEDLETKMSFVIKANLETF